MNECFNCLYRDIMEPSSSEPVPHWTCICKSSPLYLKVTRASDSCEFFISDNKYRSVMESCNFRD